MFYQLPPAGNPISLKKSREDITELQAMLNCSKIRLYGSGTDSLAAAIKAVFSKNQTSEGEVLLPAYTCPELVSAILFAGATPVLVDFEVDRPWLDLTDLAKKISNNTVAIIAVNLFGIPERFTEIRNAIQGRNITLIEDGAQYFPSAQNCINWSGDITILSFGRGKPVSILGGGAVLCAEDILYQRLPGVERDGQNIGIKSDILFFAKVTTYNLLLSPRMYWLPLSLPFLHLGETVYRPMNKLDYFSMNKFGYLLENINKYWGANKTIYMVSQLSELLSRYSSKISSNLALECLNENMLPLVRYPVLCETREQADKFIYLSHKYGLGLSRMYEKPLNEMVGLTETFAMQGGTPNAKSLADRLITFPTHSKLPSNYFSKLENILFCDG